MQNHFLAHVLDSQPAVSEPITWLVNTMDDVNAVSKEFTHDVIFVSAVMIIPNKNHWYPMIAVNKVN